MKKLLALFACAFVFLSAFGIDQPKTLPIGSAAPDFSLPGVDGKTYSLASFKDAKVLVVIFMCNHCPTSQAYENRVKQLTTDYAAKGVRVVAINPNNPAALRIDERGYSDVGDSFDEMKIRAKDKSFNFPYLYDGATEVASRKYGPVCTPHAFVFDQDRKLRYEGRIDDTENPAKTPHSQDVRSAIDAILSGGVVAVTDTKVFGCSIKWAEISVWIQQAKINWAKEPVNLDTIDDKGLRNLVANHSQKLRQINVWATWCGPCVEEFSQLVNMNHEYRDRGLEFVSISADDPSKKNAALTFLKRQNASGPNYIFTTDDKYKLIEAVDPKWEGALPYTLLVEPGGKVVYAHQGIIDPAQLEKIIFDDPMIAGYTKNNGVF